MRAPYDVSRHDWRRVHGAPVWPGDYGGDPACWVKYRCEACGAVASVPSTCGAEVPLEAPDDVARRAFPPGMPAPDPLDCAAVLAWRVLSS